MCGKVTKIPVLVFGCSKRAIDLEKVCLEIPEIEIIGYTDNDEEKWESEYLGKKVYSIEEFSRLCRENNRIIILTIVYHFVPAIKQIKQSGITNEICFCLYEILEKNNLFEKYKNLFVQDEIRDEQDGKTKADILLISNNGLPKKNNLYRSGFVFRRLKAYRQNGLKIDSFGFIESQCLDGYEHENERIYEGGESALLYILKKKKYKKILVHFASAELFYILDYYAEGIPVICWIHGYEIIKWSRRRFNYTDIEIKEKYSILEKESDEKVSFWREVFRRKDTCFIFVSEWLKDITYEDVGELPLNYRVIPNYIDSGLFQYSVKNEEDVYQILLIKSNKTRVYANDIAAKVILILSERDCFRKLRFHVYGDGELFRDNYEKLQEKAFPNVLISQGYLTQEEIAELHRSNGIFLSPTRQDTQGCSMCEAMSSGMVVVTNRVAAIPEYINENCGILCEKENAWQMADAIEWLADHKEKFLELSRNAAEYMKKRCGLENTILEELKQIHDFRKECQ